MPGFREGGLEREIHAETRNAQRFLPLMRVYNSELDVSPTHFCSMSAEGRYAVGRLRLLYA